MDEDNSLFPFLTTIPVRLAHIRRLSNTPVHRVENIQEHTYMVCLISYLLAEETKGIDSGAVLKKALFHDIEEAITGDITRQFKYHDPTFTKALDDVLPSMMEKVVELLPTKYLRAGIKIEWLWSKEKKEGHIVDMADSIAMLCFIHEETMAGNKWVLQETGQYSLKVAQEKLHKYGFDEETLAWKTVKKFSLWMQEQF